MGLILNVQIVLVDGWVFTYRYSKNIIYRKILLVLDRTSLVNKNSASKYYNHYAMFDIFYNNTNGDQFDQTSLAQECFDQNMSDF